MEQIPENREKESFLHQLKKVVNLKVLLITTVIFLFCLCFHWLYFINPYQLSGKKVACKILHFIFLYLIVYYLNYLICHIADKKIKCNLICAGIFFCTMSVIILLTWPGTWSWDDIETVEQCQRYQIRTPQHFITSLFQILCLQTLPFVAGVPIMQSFIAALIVGYVVSGVTDMFIWKSNCKKIFLIIVLMVIMLAPPQVTYLLSGFRMGLYPYIELLLITQLLILYKNRTNVSWQKLVFVGVLTVLVSSWRSEAFYYPLIVFLCLLLIGKKSIKLWKNFIFLGMTVVLIFSVGAFNTYLIGLKCSLTATIDPVVELIQVADEESDAQNLQKIGKVLNVEKIKANPGQSGEIYFHGEGYVLKFTRTEYNNYLIAATELAMKYPEVVVQNSHDMFSQYLNGNFYIPVYTLDLLEEDFVKNNIWNNINDKIKNPINVQLRRNIIMFFLGLKSNGEHNIVYLSWNLIIPSVLIVLCLIYKLIMRQWFNVLLVLLVLVRVAILFVTAVAPHFMYYLSVYLCSYFLAIVFITEIFQKITNYFIEKRNNF